MIYIYTELLLLSHEDHSEIMTRVNIQLDHCGQERDGYICPKPCPGDHDLAKTQRAPISFYKYFEKVVHILKCPNKYIKHFK